MPTRKSLRYELQVVVVLSLVVGTSCTEKASPQATRRAQIIAAAGGDPKTVETRIAVDDKGRPRHITMFRGKRPAPGALTTLAAECQRDAARCVPLGIAWQRAGDRTKAEAAWRRACDAGHGRGCFELGNMLSNPYLKLGREKESVPLLKKACTLKVSAACYFLGSFADRGQLGVARDAARGYYDQGCTYGHYWACQKVGRPWQAKPAKPAQP